MYKSYKNLRLIMHTFIGYLPLLSFIFCSSQSFAQQKTIPVESFDEIVISPHIEVVFRQGETESIVIESISVPMEKLNIEVKNKRLNVFLEGAKIVSTDKDDFKDGYCKKDSDYDGTVVKAVVTYNELSSIDLRGEEDFIFEDKLNAEDMKMKIYGESDVYFVEADIKNLKLSLFGENNLEVKQGEIKKLKCTSYGENIVDIIKVKNSETKLITYGESDFHINVSKKLNVTSFGESTINYSGNANLNRGIIIGETEIAHVSQ